MIELNVCGCGEVLLRHGQTACRACDPSFIAEFDAVQETNWDNGCLTTDYWGMFPICNFSENRTLPLGGRIRHKKHQQKTCNINIDELEVKLETKEETGNWGTISSCDSKNNTLYQGAKMAISISTEVTIDLTETSTIPTPKGLIVLCRQNDRSVPAGAKAMWQGVDDDHSHLAVMLLEDGKTLASIGFEESITDDVLANLQILWDARTTNPTPTKFIEDADMDNAKFRLVKEKKRGILMFQMVLIEEPDVFTDIDGDVSEDVFSDID